MAKLCECTSWEQCRFKKSGVGFAICQGTAIMPDGSPMPASRRQEYIDLWESKPRRSAIASPRRKPPEFCPNRGEELRREVCTPCGGQIQIKVFACTQHGECTIAKLLPGVHVCDGGLSIAGPIPVVVSVAPRPHEIHAKTFAAARGAGFGRIYATCEPGTEPVDADEIRNQTERQGQWRNFVEALRIGLATESPYFVTLEDDVEPCRGAGELIHRLGWPARDCGCVQLYSAEPMKRYPRGRRSKLKDENALDLLGACAMLFRRDAVKALVEWADTKGWRGDTGQTIEELVRKKASDTFVGEVLTFLGYSIWTHNPTIANHIGTHSTLGHHVHNSPNRRPLSFPGIDADLLTIFAEDLKCG